MFDFGCWMGFIIHPTQLASGPQTFNLFFLLQVQAISNVWLQYLKIIICKSFVQQKYFFKRMDFKQNTFRNRSSYTSNISVLWIQWHLNSSIRYLIAYRIWIIKALSGWSKCSPIHFKQLFFLAIRVLREKQQNEQTGLDTSSIISKLSWSVLFQRVKTIRQNRLDVK